MKMLVLETQREAEKFVERQQRLGSSVRWNGWDIVFFRPHESAVMKADGVWNREAGTYGFDNTSPVNSEGKWEIDYRNVKRAKKSRN